MKMCYIVYCLYRNNYKHLSPFTIFHISMTCKKYSNVLVLVLDCMIAIVICSPVRWNSRIAEIDNNKNVILKCLRFVGWLTLVAFLFGNECHRNTFTFHGILFAKICAMCTENRIVQRVPFFLWINNNNFLSVFHQILILALNFPWTWIHVYVHESRFKSIN